MVYEIQPYERQGIIETIEDFVGTESIDKKVMFLGSFAQFVEERDAMNKDPMYLTLCILYARILDRLDKDDDRHTKGMINMTINEYLKKAGVDTDNYR